MPTAKDPSAPLTELCRSLPGVTEDVKWGDNLVFSVGDKMFAVFNLGDDESFSFKVDPEAFAVMTRQDGVVPAPYLAKHSWISVRSCDVLPVETVMDLLEEAHGLVAARLSKKRRLSLGIDSS